MLIEAYTIIFTSEMGLQLKFQNLKIPSPQIQSSGKLAIKSLEVKILLKNLKILLYPNRLFLNSLKGEFSSTT